MWLNSYYLPGELKGQTQKYVEKSGFMSRPAAGIGGQFIKLGREPVDDFWMGGGDVRGFARIVGQTVEGGRLVTGNVAVAETSAMMKTMLGSGAAWAVSGKARRNDKMRKRGRIIVIAWKTVARLSSNSQVHRLVSFAFGTAELLTGPAMGGVS